MKTIIKTGLVVLAMGILAKFLMGGGPDKDIDLPAMIAAGALVVDVRTAGEYSGGHINGALNIPYDRITQEIGERAKNEPIIVYCHSGARSASAKRTLEKAGYTNVVNGGSLHRMHKLLGE